MFFEFLQLIYILVVQDSQADIREWRGSQDNQRQVTVLERRRHQSGYDEFCGDNKAFDFEEYFREKMWDEVDNLVYFDLFCPSPSVIEDEDESRYSDNFPASCEEYSRSEVQSRGHENRAADWFLSQRSDVERQPPFEISSRTSEERDWRNNGSERGYEKYGHQTQVRIYGANEDNARSNIQTSQTASAAKKVFTAKHKLSNEDVVVQAYVGTFPDSLNRFKKDEAKMSEAERVMLKYFVECTDKDKGLAKFIWPSIAVKSNIVRMKKGSANIPDQLVKHYKLIDAFMTLNFKRFWTRDQEELMEFEKVISDCLCNDIIEGQIVLPTHLPVVKVLVNDVSAFDIEHSSTIENKKKRSLEEEPILKAAKPRTLIGNQFSPKEFQENPPQNNVSIERSLMSIQCSMEMILKKQVETDLAIAELRNKNGAQASFMTPNSGQARKGAAGMVPPSMVDKMQRNIDLIYGRNDPLALTSAPSLGDLQDLFTQDSRVSDMMVFCLHIFNIYVWIESYCGVESLVKSVKAEINIAINLIVLNGDASRAFKYLCKNLIISQDMLLSIFNSMLQRGGNKDSFGRDEMMNIFESCTWTIRSVIKLYVNDEEDKVLTPTFICRILYPFWMLKSVIIIRCIKRDVCLQKVKMPPIQVILFIKMCPADKIISMYLSGKKFQGIYWMSDMRKWSYAGSSIRPFPIPGISYCRLFAHFEHAMLHVKRTFHNCKQQVLYDHMAKNLELWLLLIVTFIDGKATVNDLRRIEDNYIAAFKPNMNRKGSYRCIPRCTQISSIEKSGKHKIGSSWRRKFSKKNGRYVKKAFSGKPTYFICAGKPSDIYYNLCRVMDDFLERNNQRYVEFKCFFGSFLTDITSYDHLYHKYGKAKVEVYGKQMNLSTMIKSRMLHRRSLRFTLDKLTVLKKGSATDLTAAKNLNGMSLREGLRLFINRNSISNKLDKALSARNLKGLLVNKYGIYVQDIYRTSLPSYVNVHKKTMGSVVSKCLLNMGVDKCFASFVAKRISISASYESSIRVLLDNTNSLAKNFRLDAPFKCSCDVILSLGGKCGSSYGHAWIKGEDVSDSKIRMVMEISSCSKPLAIAQEKEEAIRNAAQTVLKDCIVNWEEADTDWIVATNIGQYQDQETGFVSIKDVKKCAEQLKTCAISFRDKNKNSGHIACAFLFWKKTHSEYIEDCVTYEANIGLSEHDILEKWEDWYNNILCCSISLAPKHKWCIAGYGCIIFKNKDMQESSEHYDNIRARAVIKAAHEGKVIPMKPALQVGNACLNFIMTKKKHFGMWMRRCQDLVDDTRKLSAKLRMNFGNDTKFILSRYDIENFFPNIHWDAVMRGVQFFLNDETFSNGFWVHKKHKKYVILQKPKIMENFLFISVQQLKELIMHEKDNCFFLLGERLVLRQRKGIAIGGHLSSALAIMLANYAEHMSLCALMSHKVMDVSSYDMIGGLRITDDGLLFVVVNKQWKNADELAMMILEVFVGLFMFFSGKTLNLIFEDYCDKYEFLENLVYHKNASILVRFNSKNFMSVRTVGTQTIKKGAARFSATSASIKINTIMSTMFRIRAGSSFDFLCQCDALKFIYEVIVAYKWPGNWIESALYKSASHSSQVEGLWDKIIVLFNKVKKIGLQYLLDEIDKMEEEIALFILCM